MLGTMIDVVMYGKGHTTLNTLEGCWHAYSPPTAPYVEETVEENVGCWLSPPDFVRLSIDTLAPWGCIVHAASQTKSN